MNIIVWVVFKKKMRNSFLKILKRWGYIVIDYENVLFCIFFKVKYVRLYICIY